MISLLVGEKNLVLVIQSAHMKGEVHELHAHRGMRKLPKNREVHDQLAVQEVSAMSVHLEESVAQIQNFEVHDQRVHLSDIAMLKLRVIQEVQELHSQQEAGAMSAILAQSARKVEVHFQPIVHAELKVKSENVMSGNLEAGVAKQRNQEVHVRPVVHVGPKSPVVLEVLDLLAPRAVLADQVTQTVVMLGERLEQLRVNQHQRSALESRDQRTNRDRHYTH